MESKEKENKIAREREEVQEDVNHIRLEHKERRENSTRKVNKLWLWLGVLILIFILLYWLYTIGLFEDLTGVTNG